MENREKILACALDLFVARGYDAVGVQEVCEAAGVSKPTLYHYFGSKQGVLEALVHEQCGPLLEQVSESAYYHGDLPLTLERIVETYFRFAKSEPAVYRFLLMSWFAAPENEAYQTVAAFHEKQRHILEILFTQASADHGNLRGRQHVLAMTFMGMINTHIALALNGYVELSESAVHRAVHQFSHGIYS